jgi:folate-dependent phosphoribosylglycinamide formyltransferase PurN
LLPSFPGAHAVRDALASGVVETGATIHFIDKGVDTGEIIAQVRVKVEPGDTQDSLHERIKQAERELLVATVSDIANGKVTLK